MLNCFFLYNYSLRLETDHFKRTPSDYFFLLIFNWLCCVIVGVIADFPVSVSIKLSSKRILNIFFSWLKASYGPDDFVRIVCVVSAEPRHHRKLLVWHTIQGHVFAMGSARFQHDPVEWRHVFGRGHRRGSPILFPEVQIPTRTWWPFVPWDACIFVRLSIEFYQTFLRNYQILCVFRKQYFPDAVGGVHGFGVPPVYRPNAQEANAPNAGLRNRIFGAANGWGRGQVLGNN